MSTKTVTTFGGEKINRDLCRHIQGEYYKIGDTNVKDSGECYLINGRYCRDTDYIIFDDEKGEYVINNASIISGVIDIAPDGELIQGNFAENPIYNVNLHVGGINYTLIDNSIIKNKREYRFYVQRNSYYLKTAVKATRFPQLTMLDSDAKYDLPYNCDGLIDNYSSSHDKADIKIEEESEMIAPLLKDLTFGWEFESVTGMVPSELCKPLGLITLRDGSISGLEYATIPYSGAKGIESTNLVCDALKLHTAYDNNCSLHLHIGNMPRTKEFLLALFKVLCLMQDEVFEMFPIYKKYNFGVKRKNYTKPLPAIEMLNKFDKVITPKNIDDNFDELFKFLSMGMPMANYGTKDLEGIHHHPSDPRGTSKWNIRTRYHWVNLIPILFGNKQTVEFRIHTPTTNKDKVMPYLLICSALINYTKANTAEILKGNMVSNLNDLIYDTYYKEGSWLVNDLCNYIKQRKSVCYQQTSEGNLAGEETAISGKKLKKKANRSSDPYLQSLYDSAGVDFGTSTSGNPFRTMPTSARRTERGEPRMSTDSDGNVTLTYGS